MRISDAELKKIEHEHIAVMEELERKRSEREEHEKTLKLIDIVYSKYNDIDGKDTFIELCRLHDAYDQQAIDKLYKKLPRKARKGLLGKFFA